jgi:alanyl-tRNA synthetase
MNATGTTRTFLEFFGDRGHQVVPGSSLVPPGGDPVLFTTAGMHPLTRYLEGRPHPQGRRLAGVQRCLRTTDLDEVGDDRHLTGFQMLGSWSLGDYDGPQSLRWGWELLTGRLGIDRGQLYATVFGGDAQVGPDLLSWETWTDLGVPVERLGTDNWWSNGPTGPCGPDSELFAWTGDGPPQGTPDTDGRWMELWNHVTMSYRRHGDGSLEPLPQPSVDTGMGLERLLMVVQRQPSVFDCDVFQPWRTALTGLWQPDQRSLRLLTDHLRSSIVILGDGVTHPRPRRTGPARHWPATDRSGPEVPAPDARALAGTGHRAAPGVVVAGQLRLGVPGNRCSSTATCRSPTCSPTATRSPASSTGPRPPPATPCPTWPP